MGKLSAILTLDIVGSDERLKSMLSISASSSLDLESATSYTSQNCSFGITEGSFATHKNGTISVAFTGQLLRKEKLLEVLNLNKQSYFESDAALLVTGFEILKTNLFSHLDGDFAFAIFDTLHKTLYIARDKVGTHDLYWCSNKHALIFASSLKSILITGLVSPSASHEQMACFLALGYISQDKSPIQGVNRLLPGYYIQATIDGKLSVHSFWSFSSCFSKSKRHQIFTSAELFSEIKPYIFRAVSSRIQEDMPYGAIGNKSIGSECIREALLENRHLPTPALISQFSSKEVALDSFITPRVFLKNLIPMIWSMESPSSDYTHSASYHFASKCQKLNLIPFFDTGFDQEFYDYSSPLIKRMIEKPKKPSMVAITTQYLHQKFYRFYALIAPRMALKSLRKMQGEDPRIRFLERASLFPQNQLSQASPALSSLFQGDLFLHQFYHLPKIQSNAASLFYLTIKTEVIDKTHTIRSKFALDFSRIPQSPFLDLELLEFFASLDEGVWASPDILASFPTSLLTNQEEIASKNLSSNVSDSFSSFLRDPAIMTIFQSLRTGFLVDSGFIDKGFVIKTLESTESRAPLILYQLLILEIWVRLFTDLPLAASNADICLSDLLQT